MTADAVESRTGAPHAPAGQRAWRVLAPLSLALIACVVLFAGWRLGRPGKVFYYTEGPVLGSLAALEERGHLSDLYPADGWSHPPTVLTLYPPVYFGLSLQVDRLVGGRGSLLGLRVVSAVGLGAVLALLATASRRRRLPLSWTLAVLAAALLTPGVFGVVAGAQPDSLALMWTWIGLTAGLALTEPRSGGQRGIGTWLVAGSAFVLAFFTKQSYVAAPVAFVLALLLTGRRVAGLAFAAALGTAGLAGITLLDGATGGGYAANTIGALTGSLAWGNVVSTLVASRPVQWVPLVLVAALGIGKLRAGGLPEIYLAASVLLHAAALSRTGSSVNYLVEPTFALLLLVAVRGRADAGRSADDGAGGREVRSRPPFVALLAAACLLSATWAAWREMDRAWIWYRSGPGVRVSAFEGTPLVDGFFLPSVLAHGARPWLNDPYAFGVMQEVGQWDPAPLVSDLESRSIPFIITMADLGPAPAPPGVGTREIVMAYFWRSSTMWGAITANYEQLAPGPVFVWLPREGTP